MVVYIDSRGKNEQKLKELLKDKHIPVETKFLESGDIVITTDKYTLGIERKAIPDLVCSVIGSKNSYEKSNRHLWTQLDTLKTTYPKYLVIIEGAIDLNDPYYKTFMGIYLSILYKWQIPVLLTANLEDTAQKIVQIFTSYGNYKVSSALPQAVHKAKTVKDIKISMGCCIEGIGYVTSKKLYEKEPLWISTVLGEEYLDRALKNMIEFSGTTRKDKIRNRVLNVVYNRE